MTTLTAPAGGSFSVVEDDVYDALIREIDVQDWTKTADKFGKMGHYTLIFKFDVTIPEQDEPEDMWKYVAFATGDKANLTKITRALGMPDLQAGDTVDTNKFINKALRVGTTQAVTDSGDTKSRISTFLKAKKSAAAATSKAAPARKAAPVVEDEDDEEAF